MDNSVLKTKKKAAFGYLFCIDGFFSDIHLLKILEEGSKLKLLISSPAVIILGKYGIVTV